MRDRVLAETETFYPERATLEEARAALEAHLEELAAAGQAAVTEAGRSEPVTARLERCWFPTKEYDALPSGRGVYRPACRHRRGAGAELVVCGLPASLSGGRLRDGGRGSGGGILLPGQAALITEEDRGYVLKFRPWSCWGSGRPPVPLKKCAAVVGQPARSVSVTSGKAGR